MSLAALAGVCASLTLTASPLFGIGVALVAFVAALAVVEPLAQEVDRPDRTDGLPLDRGRLFVGLLVGPVLAIVALGLIGATAAALVEPAYTLGAFALAVPVAVGGSIGAIVSTVRDAPPPPSIGGTNLFGRERGGATGLDLPEFSGMSNVMTGLMPIVFSAAGAVPVWAVRVEPGAATILRATIGVALAMMFTVWWIRRRDAWGIRLRRFFDDGRATA